MKTIVLIFCTLISYNSHTNEILDEELQSMYFEHQLEMLAKAKEVIAPDKYIETVIHFVDMENPQTQIDGKLSPGEFAITLDDGPDPRMTSKVLDVLKEFGVKVNFFLVGRNAKSFPYLVHRQKEEGHSICNHSYAHNNIQNIFNSSGMIAARNEITLGLQDVFDISGGASYPFFRFPYGAFNNYLTNEVHNMGLVDFFWSGYSFSENVFKKVKVTENGVEKTVKNHGIILQHDTGEHPGFDLEMRYFLTMMKKYDYKAVIFVPSYLKHAHRYQSFHEFDSLE